jgi:hypothetical protein
MIIPFDLNEFNLQDDSHVSNDILAFSAEEMDDVYDVPRKPNGSQTLRKSNSRVSSNGKLRLRLDFKKFISFEIK